MIDPELLQGKPLLADASELISSFSVGPDPQLDLEYVITQAQKRLHQRSEAELVAGAHHLCDMLRVTEQQTRSQITKRIQAGEDNIATNLPIRFLTFFDEYDLEDQEDFPSASPGEYVAILALVNCMGALSALANARNDSGTPNDQVRAKALADDRIMEARELVAFLMGTEFEQIFRSKSARHAVSQKHKRFRDLKVKLCDFVDKECPTASNLKAARIAYAAYQEEVDDVSTSEDPQLQITKWIGAHRKRKKDSGE